MYKQKLKKYVIKIKDNQFFARLSHSQDSKSVVEKNGFITHEEAMEWLEEELEKINPSYQKMSFFKLATILEENINNKEVQKVLKNKIDSLKEEMLFTLVIKEGVSEKNAKHQINQLCGKNWTESLKKAKNQTLDALISLEKEKTQLRLQKMVSYFQNSQWNGSEFAKEILMLIKKIPGQKIVTITNKEKVESFDINQNGEVGYAKEHENHLLKKIDMGLENLSAFIIRQFIPNSKESVLLDNGKTVLIHWKAIYGFVLTEGNLIPIPAEEVEDICNHDLNNHKIQKEEKIIYKDFSELFE